MRPDGSLQYGTLYPLLSVAPASNLLLYSGAVVTKDILITNVHAANTYYVMVFDLIALPVDGTYPRVNCFPIGPNSTLRIPIGRLALSTGFFWASSSTPGSLTLSGDASIQVQAELMLAA